MSLSPAAARRVVVAPDSFKGTLSAADAACVLAEGWTSMRPQDEVVTVPMADGGEGTLQAFSTAIPEAERMPVEVAGPIGGRRASSWLRVPARRDDETGFAVVELAATVGIELVAGEPRPLDASSRGFGEAIRAAIEARTERLVLAIGGSASSDGGAGMLQALGARVLDARGEAIPPGARGLRSAASVDLSGLIPPPTGGAVVLADVVSPLLGPDGAARTFGPQKGANPSEVEAIEHALAGWARLIGFDPATPGAGAAGGVGFALMAWGARLSSGAETVSRLIRLDEAVRGAALVVTGEGRYDLQSERGKVPSAVFAAASRAGVPVAVVAGSLMVRPEGALTAVSLSDLAGGSAAAESEPARWLHQAGAQLARRLSATG